MKLKLAAVAAAIAAGSGIAACESKEAQQAEWQYEAELGELEGVMVSQVSPGFSGEGYVTGFDAEDDSLTIHLEAPAAGLYRMRVGYRSPNGEKASQMSLNGEPFGELKLAPSDSFAEIPAGKLWLEEGRNELRFHSHWGWYDLDYVAVGKAPPRPAHQVVNQLVNPNASEETLALHQLLIDYYGTHILAGQQTLEEALRLNWNYGKMPAIVGFDLIDYSPSRQQHGATPKEIEQMLQWHELGGIATLAWHWNAPAGLIDSAGQPWWRGFYTEGTTFDVEAALADPESEDYKLLLRDIDAIAVQLKRLEEARIPVLWRPLHEAEGGWFWWGAKGPEPAKSLWRLLYDRLTHTHNINNLIWIWNSEAPEWYPGDDVVDIVSVDSYPQPGDYHPVSRSYENLVELVQDRKLVALTENGPIPDPERLLRYEAHWSWFCTWSGEFIGDGVHNSEEYIRYVLEHEYVVTLDELPDFRGRRR